MSRSGCELLLRVVQQGMQMMRSGRQRRLALCHTFLPLLQRVIDCNAQQAHGLLDAAAAAAVQNMQRVCFTAM